jgi:hypothetical protein
VYLHRGVHPCWYCGQWHRYVEGNGQIRVQGSNGILFAAPILVHHYVTHHRYLPPREFIDAVRSSVMVGQLRMPRYPGDITNRLPLVATPWPSRFMGLPGSWDSNS